MSFLVFIQPLPLIDCFNWHNKNLYRYSMFSYKLNHNLNKLYFIKKWYCIFAIHCKIYTELYSTFINRCFSILGKSSSIYSVAYGKFFIVFLCTMQLFIKSVLSKETEFNVIRKKFYFLSLHRSVLCLKTVYIYA